MIKELLDHPYVSKDVSIEYYDEPYRHFILRNIFNAQIYDSMCDLFPKYIERCHNPHGLVGSTGLFYEALIYSMKREDCVGGWDFFASAMWQKLVASIFNLQFNEYTAYSLHYHAGSPDRPSKDGWPHRDLSVCSMSGSVEPGQMAIINGGEYADDSYDKQPNSIKALRSVAMLYYLNNKPGQGGGTGVYTNYDASSIVKTISPENNSLFAFEIGPDSYHGYVGANYNRSAMVQWFHSSPSYIVGSNIDKFQNMWRNEGRIFEYWKKENLWSLDMDPDYKKYFYDIPLTAVFE